MLVVMDIDGGAGTGIDEGHRHQHRQLSERDGGTSLSITDSALRSRSQRVEGGGDEKEEERRSKVTGQKFGEEGRGGEEEGGGEGRMRWRGGDRSGHGKSTSSKPTLSPSLPPLLARSLSSPLLSSSPFAPSSSLILRQCTALGSTSSQPSPSLAPCGARPTHDEIPKCGDFSDGFFVTRLLRPRRSRPNHSLRLRASQKMNAKGPSISHKTSSTAVSDEVAGSWHAALRDWNRIAVSLSLAGTVIFPLKISPFQHRIFPPAPSATG
mmetsp:Transcript_16633/g.39830  ORF Transcript_16633/g.39830 Transcript_16633/m.39830 type:complete len:267 (-) Transcript_16633:203-1003(-)